MSGKGLVVNRTHGNGIGATHASLSQNVASEFDRSMIKATYVDDTPVPVVVMDCDHTIEYLNSAAALMAGTTREASIGLKLWDLFDNEKCRAGTCFTSRVIKEGRTLGGDAVCTIKGRKTAIRTYASPRFDENNKIIGVVQVIEDNSEELRFVDEVSRLVKASLDGQLSERGDSEKLQGRYRDLMCEINTMLDAVIGPLNVAAGYVARISKGDIPPKIMDDYSGDFNEIKNNLNQCIENLNGLSQQMVHMSTQHDRGEIDVVMPAESFQGVYRGMAEGVNTMVIGHISVKKKAMACVAEFSKGNFDAELEKFPGKKAFINDNIERLRANFKRFIEEMKRMSDEHNKGDIDVAIPVEHFEGAFREMARGVNEMVGGHIQVKKKAMACVAEFGKGNFEAALERFPGKKAFINDNIERLRANVKAFIKDMTVMADAHIAGDIDVVIPEEQV